MAGHVLELARDELLFVEDLFVLCRCEKEV